MKVLMHISAARAHMGGGGISMWRVAEALAARGVGVRVTASQVMTPRVRGFTVTHFSRAAMQSADVVLTVAGGGGEPVFREMRRTPVPVVSFVHSATRPLLCAGASLLVWGSAALRDRALAKGFRSDAAEMVLWPPFDPDAVRVDGLGDRVTLVNLMAEKGAHLFWQIVRRMPDVQFLGVKGGWNQGRQVIPSQVPANAEVMKHSPDPRAVYARTRLLLYMRGPDAGPDWLNGVGLAAMEAAVSGIPTVAHPGPGLVESMGDAATWVDSDDPAEWEEVIRSTLEPARWAERSTDAAMRADTFGADEGIDRLVEALETLAARKEALVPC